MDLDKNKSMFEAKIKPILSYVGAIGATILMIAYIILVFVLINGFKVEEILQTSIFGIVTAAVGFVIMQFLKIQGISFAKNKPDNLKVVAEYKALKPESQKKKKSRNILHYWITSVIKDIIIKCGSVAITSIGLVYICIKGSGDYGLLLLALVNLLMFICFGFLALTKAYDFYNEEYVNYMKEKIEEGAKKDDKVQ